MFVYNFYKFISITDLSIKKDILLKRLNHLNIKGTILLASEGINVNISQEKQLLDKALKVIDEQIPLSDIHINKTKSDDIAFQKLKVKVKNEIIRFNSLLKNSDKNTLKSITPHHWDKIIRNDAQIIDMRNNFEYNLGTFKGAINLCLINFTDLKDKTDELNKLDRKKKTAIFCTGGIRCEKSTNYLLGKGVKKVHHLKGGILKYLEEIPEERSSWEGDCFVFDARVSVRHALTEGPHQLCYACRHPILPKDQNHSKYEHGVSCHQCFDKTSDYDKSRFRERQKQIKLARVRGKKHMVGYDGS